MKPKHMAIVVILITLIGVVVYFLWNKQKSLKLDAITNFEECIQAGYPALESYPAQCRTPDGKHFVEEVKNDPLPSSGSITISGETTCLPKIGQSPQTLECSIGFKGVDGRYYALRNLSNLDPEYRFSVSGVQVEVTGTFSREQVIDPNGSVFDAVGTIDAISILEISDTIRKLNK